MLDGCAEVAQLPGSSRLSLSARNGSCWPVPAQQITEEPWPVGVVVLRGSKQFAQRSGSNLRAKSHRGCHIPIVANPRAWKTAASAGPWELPS